MTVVVCKFLQGEGNDYKRRTAAAFTSSLRGIRSTVSSGVRFPISLTAVIAPDMQTALVNLSGTLDNKLMRHIRQCLFYSGVVKR